jgi:hypothetical protein
MIFGNERWTGVDLDLSRRDIYPRGKKDKLLRVFVFLFLFESFEFDSFCSEFLYWGSLGCYTAFAFHSPDSSVELSLLHLTYSPPSQRDRIPSRDMYVPSPTASNLDTELPSLSEPQNQPHVSLTCPRAPLPNLQPSAGPPRPPFQTSTPQPP